MQMNVTGNEVHCKLSFHHQSMERKPTVESAVVVKREAAYGELR